MTAVPLRAALSAPTLSFCGLLWGHAAVGEEVVMTNGDRLTGRILQADQDTVVLETAYAGTVAIERSQVRTLRRDTAQPGRTAMEPPGAEPSAVPNGAKPNNRHDIAARPADKSSVPARAGSAQPSPFTPGSKLSGRVNFSLSDEKGNTDKNEIDFDYQVEYRQGWHRLRSLGALEFDTNDTEKTTDKWSTLNHVAPQAGLRVVTLSGRKA